MKVRVDFRWLIRAFSKIEAVVIAILTIYPHFHQHRHLVQQKRLISMNYKIKKIWINGTKSQSLNQ
jgi:hypothetical protein